MSLDKTKTVEKKAFEKKATEKLAEELDPIALLAAPEGVTTDRDASQNPDILFWVPEFVPDKTKPGEIKKNPVRGFLLDVFDRPPNFGAPSEDEEEDEDGEMTARRRLACWVLTSQMTMVRDRNGDYIEAKAGSVVWMDLNHAIFPLVKIALPKRDATSGRLTEIVEFSVAPSHKVPFKKGKQTRMAWRMRLTGGRTAAKSENYRVFNEAQIDRLGSVVVVPELLVDVESAAIAAGLGATPDGDAPMLLDEQNRPLLPAST